MVLQTENQTARNQDSADASLATIVVPDSESTYLEQTPEAMQIASGAMKNYMKIFGGQAFSLVGSALVQFALVWWLTYTTGSAIVLTLASMMVIVPQILVSPFAGALVDRWSRRSVMIVSDALSALIIIGLSMLWAAGTVQIGHIFGAMALRSCLGSFQWPALQATASLMVPKEHLSRVNGMYQALTGLARIAAPALGALLLVVLPIQFVLLIDVGTAAMAILPLSVISVPQPQFDEDADTARSGLLSDIMEGFSYMRSWTGGRFVTIALMLSNFILIPTFALSPLLVLHHFGGGAVELAWIESMMGVGMVLGGIMLGVWGGFKRRMLTAIIALLAAAASIFLVGLAPADLFILAVSGMFIAGIMIPLASGSIMAVVQTIVPPEIQGRIFTVLMTIGPAMTPVGLMIAGVIVEAFNIQSWFFLGGIVLAIIGIVGGGKKSVMNLGQISESV